MRVTAPEEGEERGREGEGKGDGPPEGGQEKTRFMSEKNF